MVFELKYMINKKKLYEIVFEADTREGKIFDVALLVVIAFSILVVMLESVPELRQEHRTFFINIEWVITIIFTVEYLLRIYIVEKPLKYVVSFYGIIDLFSTLPSYLSLFILGAQGLIVIRSLRLLRIFRILKMPRHLKESNLLIEALKASKQKIFVFLFAVAMIVIIVGTIMYIVEPAEAGFTSIPRSVYWAIVTLTTVGYGDIAPTTPLGQFIAGFVMILGYAIIAVPTGIVTSQINSQNIKKQHQLSTQVCPSCLSEGHDSDAIFCKYCGTELNP